MTEELTIKLQDTTALPPVQWNREEVETWLEEQVGRYRGRAYNPEDIKAAKQDRAAVNRIKKELAAAQKRVQDLYKAPLAAFVDDMARYRRAVSEISADIDAQIKRAEETEQEQRREELAEVFRANVGDELGELLSFDRILDPKWLNKSTPISTARRALLAKIEEIRAGMEDLRGTCGDDFAAIQREYLHRLSLNDALTAYRHLQETRQAQARAEAARKAAQDAAASAPIVQRPTEEQQQARAEGRKQADAARCITWDGRLDMAELREQAEAAAPRYTRGLIVHYTAEQGRELMEFLRSSGIQFRLL